MYLHRFDINNDVETDFYGMNENFALLENKVAGGLVKDVSGKSSVTLTKEEASNTRLVFTGTLTGNMSIIVPTTPSVFVVQNRTTGNYTLTLRTENGSGVIIQQANLPNYPRIKRVLCDGTDITWADDGQIVEDNLHEETPDAGYYIRYANGVQVCYGDVGEQLVTTPPYQSGYRSENYLFAFPQPFTSPPAVTVSARQPGNYGVWIFPRSESTTQWGFRAMSFNEQTDRNIGRVTFMAIGRWK